MPPKKMGRGASKAVADTPARASKPSEGPAVPTTVTTNRGKEYETTAAMARPRRSATNTTAATSSAKEGTKPAAKVPAKKTANATIASPTVAKKRGRPAKAAPAPTPAESEPTVAKKRGMPSKAATVPGGPEPAVAKKRGRPAKAVALAKHQDDDEEEEDDDEGEEIEEPAAKRSRTTKVTETEPQPKRKPGRPAKATNKKADPEEAPDALDTPAPRKRGRGPKGGETTKISTDDADAADQLEDELVDATEHDAADAVPGQKHKATTGAKKGKGKAAKTKVDVVADGDDDVSEGKSYWLMKAEQIDREVRLQSGAMFNTKFTIDDLKAATTPEVWDGVRNVVARNNMRKMKAGDLAFFYASQSKGKLQPGITGIMEIVKEHEPDKGVHDENSYGYLEPNRRDKQDWSVVHVEFRKKLSEPVTLRQLQTVGSKGGVLSNMELLKQGRLSVCKVSEKEWDFIVDNLIEGYEDEKMGKAAPAAASTTDVQADAVEGAATDDPVNGSVPVAEDAFAIDNAIAPAAAEAPRPASRGVSRQASLAPPVINTTETVEETTTTVAIEMAIDSAAPTSRPASRAASKKPASRATSKQPASRAGSKQPVSRAGSAKPPSRATSLVPPNRPVSRGRDRTPKPHAAGGASHMESVLEENITTEELDQIME